MRDNEPMEGGIAYIPDPLRSPDRRAGIGPALARAAKAAWPMHILPSPLPPACTPARGDQRGRAVSRRPLPNVPSNSEWMLLSVFHWVRAGSAMSTLASADELLHSSGQGLAGQEPDRQAGHALEIGVNRDERQIAFERCCGDQGIDIADQAWALGRAQCAAEAGVAFEDGVRERVGSNFLELLPQVDVPLGKVRQPFQVLDDFAVDEDAGRSLPTIDPRIDESHGSSSPQEVSGEGTGIE